MMSLDRAPCGVLEQVREERVPLVGRSRGSSRCGILVPVPVRGEARKRGQGGLVLVNACRESWNWLDDDPDQVARQKQGGIGTLLVRADAVRDGPGLGGLGERDRGRKLAWWL